jgi:hypothetical protein
VSFYDGGGSGAEAKATIGDGIVGTINITDGGFGYSSSPTINFVGLSSVSAEAVSIISNGSISEIKIINAGLGYTEPPLIQISSPAISGSGSYIFNEEVVGSSSSITARVRDWDVTTLKLQVSSASGEFIPGELIVGLESGASYEVLREQSLTTNDQKKEQGLIVNGYTQNDDIQIASNEILDFSETNPFGTP